MLTPFAKMHGARNDFVVIDARTHTLPEDLAAMARRLCAAHAGIGADGVLLILPAQTGAADVRMRVLNADGGEAEMCGNGVRCVARYIDDAGEAAQLRVETPAGVICTHIVSRGLEYRVRVAMGTPRITPHTLNFPSAHIVSLGNPHVVVFKESIEEVDLVQLVGSFAALPQFAHGVNVHVAVVDSAQRIRARHYERGVGETMACGTGAVAIAAVAIGLGVARSPIEVFVPGGRLEIEIPATGEAVLTGPAMRVFDGEIDLS